MVELCLDGVKFAMPKEHTRYLKIGMLRKKETEARVIMRQTEDYVAEGNRVLRLVDWHVVTSNVGTSEHLFYINFEKLYSCNYI